MRKKADLRPQLEAMAEGRALAAEHAAQSGTVIDAAIVEKHRDEFTAWSRFTSPRQAGEPLTAPAELLTPLP